MIQQTAAAVVLLVIDEYIPEFRVHNRDFILTSLNQADASSEPFEYLGIDENHVYTQVAGIRIVLLDFEEAVFRADLFKTQAQHQALRELASKERAKAAALAAAAAAAAAPSPTPATPTTTTTTTVAKVATTTVSPKKKKTKSPVKNNNNNNNNKASSSITKKPCMNGADCRNILNETCPYYHSLEEITSRKFILVEQVIGISTWAVGWIIGTNGENIENIKQTSNTDVWIQVEEIPISPNSKETMRMLHVLGCREDVQEGMEMVLKSAARCAEEQEQVTSKRVEALIGIAPDKQVLLLEQTAVLEEMKTKSGADIIVEKGSVAVRVIGTKEAVDTGIQLVTTWAGEGSSAASTPAQSNVSVRAPDPPPANINDSMAWPSLSPAAKPKQASSVTAPQPRVVPAKPMIQSTKKATTSKASKPIAAKQKKKKANAAICIHGVNCRFIRNGVDNCEFYHSAKELELAAARDSKKSNDGKVVHTMYVPRAAVGFIIGRKGASVNEIIKESGANITNDAVKGASSTTAKNQDRVVRIVGSQKAVDCAVEMITERIPIGFNVEPGPGPSTSTVTSKSISVVPKPAATLAAPPPQVAPVVDAPSPSPVVHAPSPTPVVHAPSPTTVSNETPTAPPPSPSFQQVPPAAQQVPQPSAFTSISSNVSASSGNGTQLSDVTPSSNAFNGASSNVHQGGLYHGDPAITGETIPTFPPIGRAPPGMTYYQEELAREQQMKLDIAPSPSLISTVSDQSAPDSSSSKSFVEPSPRPPPPPAKAVSMSPSDLLLATLKEQSSCLKGSPEAFCEWLSAEDIVSLDDLAEAVGDDDYLREVLQKGDGRVGVKGFKRNAFKTAIVAAAESAAIVAPPDGGMAVTSPSPPPTSEQVGTKATGTNMETLSELYCPISHVLMVNDPVIAADGHTYERVAIETWFRKQRNEIMAAKQQMTTVGGDSQRAKAIVERGVLSPLTHSQMPHLVLTPNHALRTMARDAAAAAAALSN